eukprot:2072536-Alexandrium_andersonii.AAC.1
MSPVNSVASAIDAGLADRPPRLSTAAQLKARADAKVAKATAAAATMQLLDCASPHETRGPENLHL